MSTKYREIFFTQGKEASELIGLFEEQPRKTLDYMLQWGDNDNDFTSKDPSSTSDWVKTMGRLGKKYQVSRNYRYGYIGVCEVITTKPMKLTKKQKAIVNVLGNSSMYIHQVYDMLHGTFSSYDECYQIIDRMVKANILSINNKLVGVNTQR